MTTLPRCDIQHFIQLDTVEPRPKAHMDIILFKVFFEEYPLDSQDQIVQ